MEEQAKPKATVCALFCCCLLSRRPPSFFWFGSFFYGRDDALLIYSSTPWFEQRTPLLFLSPPANDAALLTDARDGAVQGRLVLVDFFKQRESTEKQLLEANRKKRGRDQLEIER
jgi:hypothetical protein